MYSDINENRMDRFISNHTRYIRHQCTHSVFRKPINLHTVFFSDMNVNTMYGIVSGYQYKLNNTQCAQTSL